jgi:glycosyltransferase involved in cell wall biosynthesis
LVPQSHLPDRRWLISQIGSRELYACPLSFERLGTLRYFYTDFWCRHFRGMLGKMPAPIWGLARRYQPELPSAKVVSFNAQSLLTEARQYLKTKSTAGDVPHFLKVGSQFARNVAKQLARLNLDPARDIHLAFSTGALESLQYAKSKGILAVLDQLDPGRVDEEMVAKESLRWPGWDAGGTKAPESYWARHRQEWAAADLIIVNSEFSRQSIHKQGVPLEKLAVVPLAYENETPANARTGRDAHAPLNVLWLGQITLRKGLPYLFEAARLLKDANVRFTVAGRIVVTELGLKTAPPNVEIVGRVTRERAVELYRSSDVFVLPTVSDGFAITQLEAMSYGLPVITTPNCGDVVTPGEDGYIVPIRDPQKLADAIGALIADRGLLERMSEKARLKSSTFTLARYANTIEDAVANLGSAT